MDLTSDFVKTFTKLANKSFFESFDLEPVVYPQLFNLHNVDQEFGGRDYGIQTTLIGLGEPEEISEVEEHRFRTSGEGFSAYWALRFWQNGFQITENMLKNWGANPNLAENYIKTQSQQLGSAFAAARDRLCAKVFNRGAITAGDTAVFNGTRPGVASVQIDPYPGLIYDNKSFFHTAHPLYRDAATTFQNFYASLAFSATNLETLMKRYTTTNNRNELNMEITLQPDVIVYNPTLEFDIARVLRSTQQPGSANNDINPMAGRLTPVPWHKITGTDDWAVGRARLGLEAYHRGEPVTVTDTKKMEGMGVVYISIVDEFSVAVSQWRHWIGCNFPTT